MQSEKQQQQPHTVHLIPKTLAQERQKVTPQEDPDDSWFESNSSEPSAQDNQLGQQDQSRETQTSNILKSMVSQKSQLLQTSASEQKEQKGEPERTQKLVRQYIDNQKQKDYKSFFHKVDDKLAILLRKMLKFHIVNLNEIAQLKGIGTAHLICKSGQIVVKAEDRQTADQAINKISDFIDDINVLKLDIKPQLASKLQKCKKVKSELFKRKIMLFNFDRNQAHRGLYIGGLFKPSELKKIQSQIKNYKLFTARLSKYRNTRSYKLVLDQIFYSQTMKRQMFKLSGVNLIEVDRSNKKSDIQVIMSIQSKIQITAQEYQNFITKNIKRFMVICFILQSHTFFQKLAVQQHPEIKFLYIKQKKLKRKEVSYLFIITEIDTFFKYSKLIAEQIQKVGKFIFGIRFFNHLFPNFANFYFDRNHYFANRFPRENTYSMIIWAKQKEGKKYDWRETFTMLEEMKEFDDKVLIGDNSFDEDDQAP